MAEGRDGWHDPYLRRVRTVAVIVICTLMVWVVVAETGPNDVATIGTLCGSLLVLLGVEALTRWPPR
jgi:uncharacterized membrane protein YccC